MKKTLLFLSLSIFINAQVDYETQIQPIWDNNCTSCHSGASPSGQLDLGTGSWNNLVNVTSANYSPALRVVPYEPNNSVLYHKVFYTNQSGNGMPPSSAGGQLPLSERQLVEQWINDGAPATGGGGSNGRIWGEITLNEEWEFNQIRMKLNLPGGGFLEQFWGEDPPFSNIGFMFDDPQITEGAPYEIVAYFDGNNNNMYDIDEPYVEENDLYVPATLELGDIYLTLESGGGGGAGPTYIDITTPNSGTNWNVGTGENIEWNSSTSDGNNYYVNIELLKDASHYLNIESDFISNSNGGMFYWSIPSSLPDGNDYQILIEHPNTGVENISDMFSINIGGGGNTGMISGDIKVDRAISGNLNLGLYYPGNSPDSGPPDEGPAPEHVNLAGGANWYYEFSNLPDGNGYTVVAFIDADGSANSGPETCDDGEDLQGMTSSTINITGGSLENADVNMDECGGGDDFPTISNFAVTNGDAYVNSSDVEIYVQLDASSGIAEAKYTYYLGSDPSSLNEENLTLETAGTGDWVGTIFANDVTMEGLMVKIFAKSNDGYETWSEWFEIPVHFNEYSFTELPHKQYTMVSFPGDLDDDNAEKVIENTLGSSDPTRWRSFGYNSSTGNYVENAGYFSAGRSLWIITSETSNGLDGGSGMVTSLENSFSLSLNQGWNMIGNPYAFNLDISNNVGASGDLEMTLYGYDGSGYVSENEMIPGEGYWIWSNEDGASLEFDHTASGGGSQKQMIGGWKFNLSAAINGYHDSENRLGAHPLADDQRDNIDAHEPPVIGDYVQLAFDNTDWTDKGIYSKDIRKEGQTSYIWNVDVKSNIAGQLSVKGFNTSYIPSEYDAVLIDLGNRVQHNLRSGEPYKYVSIGDEKAHPFQVVVGLPEKVSKSIVDLGILPTEFSVDQNVPNPFNPITSIRVQLVEDARVTIKIFNIMGEEVLTLNDNEFMESGHRQVIWNGRDNFNRQLPSGLYLYQTVIMNNRGKLLHMKTHKMIMVK